MSNLTKHKPTVMQLISEGKSKTDIIQALGNLTVADLIGHRYPAISLLRKLYTPEKVHTTLAVMIVESTAMFESSISKDAALDLAIEISTCYYYLSPEDIYVVLQQLKRTNLYGRCTPARVLQAVEQHTAERLRMAEERSFNEHLAIKESRQNYDGDRNAEAVRAEEAFRQFSDDYSKSKQKRTPKNS